MMSRIANLAALVAIGAALSSPEPCHGQEAQAADAAQSLAGYTQSSPSYTLGGTIEARPFARFSSSSAQASAEASYGSATSLGLELNASGGHARAAASIEAALLSGTAASDAWALAAAASGPGSSDEGMLIVPAYGPGEAAPSMLLEARIRSLYVKLDYDSFALTAGRQVVNYARASLWSPTDPFTVLDLTGLSPLRRGTDALRLAIPLGSTGAFDLVAAPDSGFSAGRYASRISGFLPILGGGIDGAVIGCRDCAAAAWSFGADFKTDLVAGIDGEALYTLPDSGTGWLRASGGADYSIGDFVMAAEYYYNGGGAAADSAAPGAHNAYGSLAWKAGDFVSVAASCIAALSSKGCVATLSATVDAAQNAQVVAYARLSYAGIGEEAWASAAEAGAQLKVKF